MEWCDCQLHLMDNYVLNAKAVDGMEDALFIWQEDDLLGEDWLDLYAIEIL